MIRPRLITLFLGSALLVSCGADLNVKRAEKSLAIGEYFEAAEQYRIAYRKTPPKERTTRGKIAREMARCYARINQTPKALSAYRNAIRYRQASFTDSLAYARLLLKNGDYKQALEILEALDTLDNLGNPSLVHSARISAMKAPLWKKQGSAYKVRRMDIFNSRRDDYSPMLLGDDGDQLFFSSTRNEATGDDLNGVTGTKSADIFLSQKDDRGKWSRPEVLDGGVNTAYDEGACAFSPDGRTMVLTQCATDAASPRLARIVQSNRSDAAWGKTQEVLISRDTLSLFAHPAISPDGQWLYFVSDMPGGRGGLDIWRSRLTANGPMGAENLGEPVNTAGNEEFPTFRPNGDLYFSSDGHPGLGGLDIFVAKEDQRTHRFSVSHPGWPLNSEGDDFGMTFEGMHNRGFFCSNRSDGRGYDHIYSFDNPEVVLTVKGWVYEREGYELPAAEVYIVGNDGTNRKVSVRSDGSFTMTAAPGTDYLFMASCKGFLNHRAELTVPDTCRTSHEYTLQFPLASISAPVLIDNIFYDFDKATLRKESEQALSELAALLKENPNVTIELSAHCDYKGSEEYNRRLSQRRAENVVNYLVRQGIARDRLTPVGYGKDKPKVVRRKLTEQYPWLHENDVLTTEFILRQTPEHQAVCNQLNRRTEFRVLRTTYGLFDEHGNLKTLPKVHRQEKTTDDGFVFDIE